MVQCETQRLGSIYIAANGDVSPCCFTGFYPRTYGRGQYHQAANAQLVPMINCNNALEHTIEECISWFNSIKQSWSIDTFEQGRLVICDDNCGTN
jgi:MoaA/NifB/PqqE/SkfB family radical SAM enzyme